MSSISSNFMKEINHIWGFAMSNYFEEKSSLMKCAQITWKHKNFLWKTKKLERWLDKMEKKKGQKEVNAELIIVE